MPSIPWYPYRTTNTGGSVQAPFIRYSANPKVRLVNLNSDCCATIDLMVKLAAAAGFLTRDNCRCRARFRKRYCLSYGLQSTQLLVVKTTARNPSIVTSSATMQRMVVLGQYRQSKRVLLQPLGKSSKPPTAILFSRPVSVQDRNACGQLGHPVHTFQQ